MHLNKKSIKRFTILFLVALILLPCFSFMAASEEVKEPLNQDDVQVSEMVCRIKNVSTGLYLDSYKYTLKTKGKSYTEKYSESSLGQVFHLSPCDDGTYKIIPQNDNAEYAYVYSEDTTSDKKIKKIRTSSAGDLSKFDIVEYQDDQFLFAPSNTKNNKLVLTQSSTISEYKDNYIELLELDENATNQLWSIEPIKTEKLSVIYTSTKVRLYSSGTFYARKYPYNAYTHDIKWTSSDDSVIMIGEDGTWCALSIGEAKITASVDGVSKSFIVKVTDRDAFTWYSQNNIYTSDWDATQLKFLSFYSGRTGKTKKFAIDSKEPGGNNCWLDQGCGNCSVAMVLNNMGATKTTGFDFRSGQVGELIADPYTVALANSGNYGSDTKTTWLRGDPIYMAWAYTAEQFNVDGQKVILNKMYNPSTKTIKNLLADHPEGVIVQVSKGVKNHYIVFAKCTNPEEKYNSRLKFIVCDSAAYLPENGDYVMFEQSTSYLYEGYRYSNIASVMYFTLEEKKEGN